VAVHAEDFVILACIVLIELLSMTEEQTDRQTPRPWLSNLAKSEIASRLYSPGGGRNLQLHVLTWAQPEISPTPRCQEPCLTQCVIGVLVKQFKEDARM